MARAEIRFILNGKEIAVRVEPKRSLLRFLREDLEMTGAKEGCSTGHCGACSVLIDGALVRSCKYPMRKVAGREVTTIEGLGSLDDLHPIQEAFIEVGAVQCGFCTPGMIMAAKALLDKNPHPTHKVVVERLFRNLCRCTGYVKIVDAILLAAKILRGEATVLKEVRRRAVGESVHRVDALEKVLGLAKFASDLEKEGMLYAKVLRSPHSHAKIERIDTTRAEAIVGVEAILTAADIPGRNRVGIFRLDQPILGDEKVRYVGEPIAVVAAVSEEVAERALSNIAIDYLPLPELCDPFQSLGKDVPKIHDEGNTLFVRRIERGDVQRGFREADIIIQNTYTTPFNEHAYLETEAGIAYVDEESRIVICAGTQNPHYDQSQVAAVLGVDLDRVRVIQTVTGGGFGGKLDISVQCILGLLAWKLRRPVKLVYTREESFLASPKRHPFHMEYRTGATKSGRLTALEAHILADTGAYASFGPGVITRAAIHATGPYYFPNVLVEGTVVYTNNPFCGAMRGFGVPQVTFAIESQMDIMARELGIDPLQFRYDNAFIAGSVTSTGQILDRSTALRETLEAVQPYYIAALRERDSGAPGVKTKRGVGLASMWFGIGKTSLPNRSEAWVELREDGKIRILSGAAEIGQGVRTVLVQIAAEELGVPCDSIEIIVADTALTPDADFTCASRQTYISGNAVRQAANRLREALFEVAAKALGTTMSELVFENGRFSSLADPSLRIDLGEMVAVFESQNIPFRYRGMYDLDVTDLDDNTGEGIPYPSYSFGTQMAEVEVDLATGRVKVLRVVAAQDVGKAINPSGVEGQMQGGVLMGLGFALKEEFVPGETFNLAQYEIPMARDMPEINTIILEVADLSGPFGAKGAGESASVPTAPAIINAIVDATGARVYELPANPARVWQSLRQVEASGGRP